MALKQEPGFGDLSISVKDERIAASPRHTSSNSARSTGRGDLVMIVLFLLLVNVATFVTAGWLIYGNQQSLAENQQLLAQADVRIQNLENQLTNTGEDQQANLQALQIRINAIDESSKLNFSEVDKLWANYRKFRDAIAANEEAIKVLNISSSTNLEKLFTLEDEGRKYQQALARLKVNDRFKALEDEVDTVFKKLVDLESLANSKVGDSATNAIAAKVDDLAFQLQFLKEDLQVLQSANTAPVTP